MGRKLCESFLLPPLTVHESPRFHLQLETCTHFASRGSLCETTLGDPCHSSFLNLSCFKISIKGAAKWHHILLLQRAHKSRYDAGVESNIRVPLVQDLHYHFCGALITQLAKQYRFSSEIPVFGFLQLLWWTNPQHT